MSFGLPGLRGKHQNQTHTEVKEDTYGIPNVLSTGLGKAADKTGAVHPVQAAIKHGALFEEQLHMNVMRDIQGIHAPLRIAMELKMFKNVGRLPFLPSSNLSADVIRGRDDYIDFRDILYTPEVHERMAQPHAVMEQKLGIL